MTESWPQRPECEVLLWLRMGAAGGPAPHRLLRPWTFMQLGLSSPGSGCPGMGDRALDGTGKGPPAPTPTQSVDTAALETMCFIWNLVPREPPPGS